MLPIIRKLQAEALKCMNPQPDKSQLGRSRHYIDSRQENGKPALALKGEWIIANITAIEEALQSSAYKKAALVSAAGIENMDTAGAWLITWRSPRAIKCGPLTSTARIASK